MNQFLNEKHFETPSLTPIHQFKSDLPPSIGRLGTGGQTTQTLILNINGTTNINNFHTGPTHGPSASLQQVDRIPTKPAKAMKSQVGIQGRRNLPEPHLRVAEDNEPKKNLLPKKLLKQAKSAKNARITPKCIMQKTLKAAAQIEAQTGRVQNKSQFDFNFKKKANINNVTIDYDLQKKKKSGLQNNYPSNKTQNLTVLQQKVVQPKSQMKTTRSMAQAKQSKSLSKRPKADLKKVITSRPKTMINNLLTNNKTSRGSAMKQPTTLTSSIEMEKENINAQNYSNEKKLSISSFSSRSNKGRGDEIADKLQKNYFLNSKQLLNHLSPARDAPLVQPSTLSQANKAIRGRTRSIAVASNIPKPANYQKRKHNSQSQSRSNQQQLQTGRVTKPSIQGTSRHDNDLDVLGKTKPSRTQPIQSKKVVDKLIKDNIRKNKNKQDEEQVKKQLEQQRLQQRKADLTQRNQEVRMMNASKIVNQAGDVTLQIQSPAGSNRRVTSAKESSQRRRSQSCFDYQAFRRKVNSGNSNSASRRGHHSQENKNQYNQILNLNNISQNDRPSRQRGSYVDEITRLTQLIEQEIGPSSRVYQSNPIKSLTKQKKDESKMKKSRPSVELQRFIEKKKREEQIKRSLEQTIEVDKQQKIQQNLNTLEKYVKKGIKPKSTSKERSKSLKAKSQLKRHKRSNTNAFPQQDPSQIVGLSEIFYQNYKEETSPFTGIQEYKNQTPSVLEEPSIYAQTQTQNFISKNSYQNSGKQSFVSTNQNYPRKAVNQSVSLVSGPLVVEVDTSKRRPLNKSLIPKNSKSLAPQLAKKHPALQNTQEVSPKSSEQLRRIHEFVALYKKRCVLKPGVSDATVMGTLHSAASVIQIHFRYYKRMKAAGLHKKSISSYINSDADKKGSFNHVQRMGKIDISQIESIEQSDDYINTTDKKRQSDFTVQNEDYWAPSGIEQFQQAFNQRQSLEEHVMTSVISGFGNISGQHTLMPSPPKRDPKQSKNNQRPKLDLELIEEANQQYNQSLQQPNSAFAMESQNSGKGPKTPLQVPGLDLRQLKEKKVAHEKQQQEAAVNNKVEPSPTSQDPPQTASSYSGIFNRLGLPLPRSARVKVEYSLVQKDPKIKQQLKEIVELKGKRGQEIMMDGLRDRLITERTYEINRVKLEKWVNASHNKIDENQASRRSKIHTQEELLQAAVDGRARLQKIITSNEERQSARSGFPSGRSARPSQSGRGQSLPGFQKKVENYSDRDPYRAQQNIAIGSGRQHKSKLVELINRDSSRTSSKPKREQQSSSGSIKNKSSSYRNYEARLDEIELQIEDPKTKVNPNNSFEEKSNNYYVDNLNDEYINKILKEGDTQGPSEDYSRDERRSNQSSPMDGLRQLTKEYGEQHQQTEKSLNRSQSYHTMPKDLISESIENLNQYSGHEDDQSNGGNVVYPDQIEIQLEDALRFEQQKLSPDQTSIEALRDPRFFMRQVDENEVESKRDHRDSTYSDEKTKDRVSNINDDTTMDKERGLGTSYIDSSNTKSQQTNHKLIKVENQQYEDPQSNSDQVEHSPPRVSQKNERNLTVDVADESGGGVIPVSPVSDHPIGFESKIQTGAHSLSSTDSDMAKAIHAAHSSYESPPDLVSPKNPLEQQVDIPPSAEKKERGKLADQLTDYLLQQLLREMSHDMDTILPRHNITRPRNAIKFFEKKGIKTDLFAIEKYVDEVLEEVKLNRQEFMTEINRALSQDAQSVLFQMQNSEIGTYEHFQVNLPPVLSLDLYLKLEKRRKESREHATQQSPDGRFDFENVNEDELIEDGVDKNFLAECQHIHNKVLFDCINDSLQQFRPHGKDGEPMSWSRVSRKLKPTEDFTLEEMFEITKHDLFRMAIMQAGTLPRREFVFGNLFDEDLFAEIREKKLATLLCREIVDNEPQWLKWDFEEAQTKIDIADMVLESLVTETIVFLTSKQKESNSAQVEFEKIQSMIQSKS